jgi:serine/threonine-protein kinase
MLTAGSKLGPYEILSPLGAGGMGEVYLAHDARLSRDVAIKVLPADRTLDESARQRFLREARAASALNHPNIITIYEADTYNDVAFIAMEHVRGRTVAELLRARSLADAEAVAWAAQIADALSKAHAAGIIHRDLKPGNVMVTEDGLVKVLDYGLAKVEMVAKGATAGAGGPPSSAETMSRLSMPGSTLGTLSYMSPEQARGEPVDARSDIFSLGIVLFEMLTRELPFTGDNFLAVLHSLHFGAPRDLRYLRPDLAPYVAAVVGGCLQKLPADRYQNAAEIARDLRAGAVSGVALAIGSSPASAVGLQTAAQSSAVAQGVSSAGVVQPAARKSSRRWQRGGVVALLVLLAALLAVPAVRHRMSLLWEEPQPASGATNAPVPDNPFALQHQAEAYLERWDVPDNLDRSIALLNRALEIDHDYAPAYASLTFAYFEKNRINADPQWAKQASQSAARAVQLNSDLADAHLAAGVAAMLAGKGNDAEEEFRKAADLDPKSPKPHFWMGFKFSAAGNSKAAEKELTRALALDPDHWRARMNLGLLYYKTARYADSATVWEQVSKLTPDNFIVLNNLAAVYHQLDRYEDAAAVLQRSLQIRPDAYTYGNLGTLRFFQGRYEDAVPVFEKAVKLEANEYLWWGNLGDGYRWAPGQRAKAAPAYENAIRLARERLAAHADDQDARTYLALYLAKTGNKNAALAEVAKFDAAPTKEAETLFRSAVVHELCGERDAAVATLSAAAKRGYSLKEIRNEPELLSLRADPRYQTLVTNAARK